MTDYLKFDFCEVDIYDHYMVVKIDEGLTVQSKHNTFLKNVADTYYLKKDFVYITHRIHSYSVDPATYYETAKITNLKAFAVVSEDYIVIANAEMEKMFFSKPYGIFQKIEDAITWAESIVINN